MNERSKAIIRLIVQMVLLINMGLTLAGKNPLDIDETALTDCLTTVVTVASSVWVWWKNNNMTEAAAYAQKSLEVLKSNPTDDGEEE